MWLKFSVYLCYSPGLSVFQPTTAGVNRPTNLRHGQLDEFVRSIVILLNGCLLVMVPIQQPAWLRETEERWPSSLDNRVRCTCSTL